MKKESKVVRLTDMRNGPITNCRRRSAVRGTSWPKKRQIRSKTSESRSGGLEGGEVS